MFRIFIYFKLFITQAALSSNLVLELASQVAHFDVHSNVVEQLCLDSWEVEVVPRSPDTTATLSSSVAHENVHSLSVELVSSASVREESLVQHFVVHNDVQPESPLGPPITRSIHVETELVSKMERLDQNETPSLVTHGTYSDEHKVLVVHEYTHNTLIIQQDLELRRRIREHDKANAEMPFTPVLSKRQKQ